MQTGNRIQDMQVTKDARNLPSRERCRAVLDEPNRDVPHWACPVCGDAASRAHWIAEHVLHHLDFPNEEPK